MIQQDQDGWETVNDPATVKRVAGADGVKRMPRVQPGGHRVDPTVSAPPGLSPAQLKAWEKANISQQTLTYVNDARKYYDENFNATGLSAVSEYFPGLMRPQNGVFDKKVAALLGPAKGAYRVTGEGAFSDADIKLLQDALPNRWNSDSSNREAMSRLDAVLRGFIRNGYGSAGLTPADINRAAAANQYASPLQRRLPMPPPGVRQRPDPQALKRKYGLK